MSTEDKVECHAAQTIGTGVSTPIESTGVLFKTPDVPKIQENTAPSTNRGIKRKNVEKLYERKKQNIGFERNENHNPSQSYHETTCSNAETVEEVLEDMEEEIDQALENRENKSKLTPANVKNILRHIIANEYVLAMVRNTMQNSDGEELDENFYEPKLTRSKAKEMRKKQCTLPWPVSTPAKKVPESSQKLLEEEFPDESSSDEDYKPTEEECPSEDELLSPKAYDAESPCCGTLSSSPISKPTEHLSEDENALVIELPELDVPLNSSEADKIALRTRSKLCLNDTPLEAIEASFIAPDITLDMYDTLCDDAEWQEFLSELSKPIDATVVREQPGEEVDDGDDPEYKVLEEDVPDYNDLRYDSSVKITRDELNALMAEILEYAQKDLSYLDDEEENRMLVENESQPADIESVENEKVQWMTEDERLQLDEQMRMYVQLLTQAYLLSHGYSKFKFLNISTKLFLDEIKMFSSREIATNQKSAFHAYNLDGALQIIEEFENQRLIRERKFPQYKKNSYPTVPQHIRSTIAQNKVFIYPELLPIYGFRENFERRKTTFALPEDNLIALGLEQFEGVKKSVEYIQSLLVPSKTVEQIRIRIKNSKVKKDPLSNPIKYYHVYKKAPEFQRVIRIFDPNNIKVPADYPLDILPRWMISYCKTPANLPIAPTQNPKEPPKVAVVRPMLSNPPKPRKLPPILPRLHTSPFKHISPILKKYSQQRRVVTVLPFNLNSPHKNRAFKKPTLKPKPLEPTQTDKRACSDSNGQRAKEIVSSDGINVSENVPQDQDGNANTCAETQENAHLVEPTDLQEEPCISEVAVAQKCSPVKEVTDEADEEIIEDDQDATNTATAPTAQKKQSVSKKRNRIQRDMEASLALLQPKLMADELKEEERETLLANSYLLRATEILKDNPEVYDKFLRTLCSFHQSTRSPVELYSKIKEILKDYPALVRDFIIFLNAEQAKSCGMYQEYVALSKIREFFRKVEMHFKNQPQHISRILRAFSQLQQQADITSAEVISALQPLLRNQSLLMEELRHLLPDAAPPDYLMTDFEEVNIPNSDDDNSSIDSCEEVEIPDTPDPYGGKDCPCDCHTSSTDSRLLNKSRHCVKCGVKFIDGRIYIQTGKVLKPAQVIYHDIPPASEKEKSNSLNVPSKSQPGPDANLKAAAASETNLKNDVAKKDNSPVEKTSLLTSTPLPLSSKLPFDVMEDTAFPVVTDSTNKSQPSDFSHLLDKIGSKNNENQTACDPKASGNQNLKWSRDEDKVIIYNCQRYGVTKKAFCSSADAISTRTAEEVEKRFMSLMQSLSKELKM